MSSQTCDSLHPTAKATVIHRRGSFGTGPGHNLDASAAAAHSMSKAGAPATVAPTTDYKTSTAFTTDPPPASTTIEAHTQPGIRRRGSFGTGPGHNLDASAAAAHSMSIAGPATTVAMTTSNVIVKKNTTAIVTDDTPAPHTIAARTQPRMNRRSSFGTGPGHNLDAGAASAQTVSMAGSATCSFDHQGGKQNH